MSVQSLESPSSIRPLSGGDLIDRAVRFYRRYFWTFVLIAAPPVVIGTIISLAWTVLGRRIFDLGGNPYSAETTFYYLFLWLGSILIWLTETIATLAVMGGASRNFVRHLLFGEAITFSETYRNTWRRLGGLIAASSIITILAGSIGTAIMYVGLMAGIVILAGLAMVFSFFPVLAVILSIAAGIAVFFGTMWLFFLAASRMAYVPQVMLVEGHGVFSAIGRSASLAGGSVKRLMALFVFSTVATYSALALLYVPLLVYGSANGVEVMQFDADLIPAWYEIASNLIWQISLVLLSPVWMIGLCLLYVDERVRGEGYDIELMAAARLGDIPAVPATYVNPLHPALANAAAATGIASSPRPQDQASLTTLGLK